MSDRSRTYNSIANSVVGIGASFVTVVLNFLVRVILVKQLGEEINGLQSLFQSITNVMLLMELGISSAIVIHLYEPVAKKDYNVISSIMSFYKRIYVRLAIIFTVVSILVAFTILDKLVTSSIPLYKVRLYFIFFTASFTINYLTYYKRSLLFAEQKNRISIIVTTLCEIVYRSIQIVLLFVFQQYFVFLILVIFEKMTSNLICNYYVRVHHPYLKENHTIISETKRNAIYSTIKPLMVNQAANTIQNSASSVLISFLLGNICIVGYFGNYQLVMNVVQMVYTQFGGAFTTSFGNLAVEHDVQRMRRSYFRSAFIMNWMASLFCALFVCCTSDFIYIFFGESFVLDTKTVVVISMSLLFYLLNIPMVSIQNALGLHRLDAHFMVIQALFAIALGYVGGIKYGMAGIIGGLLLPMILFSIMIKGVIVGRKALKLLPTQYLCFISIEALKSIIVGVLCLYLCEQQTIGPSIGGIVLKAFVCCMVTILLPALLSYKTEEFRETLDLLKKIKSRRL